MYFFPLVTPKLAPVAVTLDAQIISSFRLVITNKQETEPASHYAIYLWFVNLFWA